MVERGAQLTSVNVVEEDVPSIFEVLAQESLLSTLRPAFKHAFRVLAGHNPQRYGWLYARSDEVCASLQLILENYYLRNYGGSFSENFYGLKRVPTDTSSDSRCGHNTPVEKIDSSSDRSSSVDPNNTPTYPLSSSQHFRSLFFLVAFPYLKEKCDKLYESLSETHSGSASHRGLKGKLIRVFLWLYPLLHGAWEASVLSYQLAYVFGKLRHYSPSLRLAGVTLLNLTEEDIAHHAQSIFSEPLWELLRGKSWQNQIATVLGRLFGAFTIILSNGLSIGVFFLQFLDWWYSSDQRATAIMSLPLPSRPTQRPSSNVVNASGVCPLCLKQRTNDTVLSITGYVFCYPCIFRFVQEKHRCPVTGYPAQVDHLVKLYLSDES